MYWINHLDLELSGSWMVPYTYLFMIQIIQQTLINFYKV